MDFADFCTSFDATDIGVTGSRRGPVTQEQGEALVFMIENLHEHGAMALHHGKALGVDKFCHMRAYRLSMSGMTARVYPPLKGTYRAENLPMWPGCHEFAPKAYGARDWDIVQASAVLLAAPGFPEFDPRSGRSGTWLTVRYALRLRMPVYTADTLGNIEHYNITREVVVG